MKRDALTILGTIMACIVIEALAIRPVEYVVHTVIAVLLLASLVIPLRLNITRRSYFIICGLVLIPFALYLLLGRERGTPGFYETAFYAIGLYFCALTVPLAYKRREKPDYLILLSLVFIISMFGGLKPGRLYVPSLGALTICTIFYCILNEQPVAEKMSRRSPGYWVRIVAIICMLCGGAFGLAYALHWSETKVNSLFMMTMEALAFSPAFSNESGLESVQDLKGSNRVVLRVFTRNNPLYLVGKVFQRYENDKWRADKRDRFIKPLEDEIPIEKIRSQFPGCEGTVFHVGSGDSISRDLERSASYISVVMTALNTETLFAPRGTRFVLVNSENIRIDNPGVLYASEKNMKGEYHLAASPPEPQEESDLLPYLQLPGKIPEGIVAFNESVVDRNDSSWKIAQALLSEFHNNFKYGVASKARDGKNILEIFLLESKQGHCEFFATAMTILLRMNGIPARYLNGFLVQEYSNMGKYYVVRERDAHAWVEAYFPGKGWYTLDPTPPGGRSRSQESLIPVKIKEIYDIVALRFFNLKERLIRGDIRGAFIFFFSQIRDFFIWIFSSPLRITIFLFHIVVIILVRTKRAALFSFLRREKRGAKSEFPDDHRNLREILRELERLLASKKIRRPGDSTLYEFAGQIGSISSENKLLIDDFFNDYCSMRYGKETVEERDVEKLREKLSLIRVAFRKR